MQEQELSEKEIVRVLFVDDEGLIRRTLPEILSREGYFVTAVGTVSEALAQITSAKFDVLISDLNIGHPGDGFTVVSAMRRTQPECITLIMTGYPGFDSALEAIRSQVDDYLVKPAPIPSLIQLIEQKLQAPRPSTAGATKRISQVLRENVFEITQRALSAVKSNPGLRSVSISDEQRIEFIPRALEELATILELTNPEHAMKECIENAKMRGMRQFEQGYTIPLLAAHVRLVEQAIYEVIHEHMRSLNLSYLMLDLKRLTDTLGMQLEHTLAAFLNVEQRIGRRSGEGR